MEVLSALSLYDLGVSGGIVIDPKVVLAWFESARRLPKDLIEVFGMCVMINTQRVLGGDRNSV